MADPFLRLPDSSAPPEERYAMPDPDALCESRSRLRRAAYGDGTVDIKDVKRVLWLADGYIDLTMYELGQECCVEKLRDIWRARRRRMEVRHG